MGHMLTHSHSPLEQARQTDRIELADAPQKLNDEDQATLRQIFTEPYDYIYNELFDEPDAERRIFEEAPAIAEPDTSWYHPVLEYLDESTAPRTEGSVLLTAAEERVLFYKFNYCRYRVAELKARVGDAPLTLADAREILKWHREADRLREQIANTNLALVLAMAKRTRMGEVDFADLISEGNMALLRAVDKFDAARGFKFSTYACRAILKAFSRIGVKTSKYRLLFPTDFDPKLERSDYMEKKRQTHEDDCVDEVRAIVRDNRADLSEIERQVIEHRFAVSRKQGEESRSAMTLEEVGRIIGVTKERVRQIQNKALQKIRMTLEGSFLD